MVKFFESRFSYDYPFTAVTLAYFLRYPNPYSKHVLSTDTLSRHFDPVAQTLTTQRLHLKRGKLPSSLTRFLPKIKESYILETSTVDLRNNVMKTETRNLEWEGVLSVIETQKYEPATPLVNSATTTPIPASPSSPPFPANEKTDVTVSVRFESRLGARQREQASGWSGTLGSWGAGSVQRSIELLGMKRMGEGLKGSREGMKVVLEKMREKGVLGVMKERKGWMRGEMQVVGGGASGGGEGGRGWRVWRRRTGDVEE